MFRGHRVIPMGQRKRRDMPSRGLRGEGDMPSRGEREERDMPCRRQRGQTELPSRGERWQLAALTVLRQMSRQGAWRCSLCNTSGRGMRWSGLASENARGGLVPRRELPGCPLQAGALILTLH